MEAKWRKAVGGMWQTIGLLQFEFLKKQGLEQNHRFLDIGCGSLRGGLHFIDYLESGNYYGIDKDKFLLNAGRTIELPQSKIDLSKEYSLYWNADFDFTFFNVKFDYALAQSVFTHLPPSKIISCLQNLKPVMAPNCEFFATFFEDNEKDRKSEMIIHEPGGIITYPEKNPFHYRFSDIQHFASQADLRVTYIGDWNHPRAQKMLKFY